MRVRLVHDPLCGHVASVRAAAVSFTSLRLEVPFTIVPLNFPKSVVPRPSHRGTLEVAAPPILSGMSRPRLAARRLATSCGGRPPLPPLLEPTPAEACGHRGRSENTLETSDTRHDGRRGDRTAHERSIARRLLAVTDARHDGRKRALTNSLSFRP